MNTNYRIGFVGFGHMAQILFEGVTQAKVLSKSQVLFCQRDTQKMKANEQRFGCSSTSLKFLLEQSDVVLLCMRPQQIDLFMQELSKLGTFEDTWFISILAGTKLAYFQDRLGPNAQIIRAMPNVASSVQEGMTILAHNNHCSAEFQAFATQFFGATGQTIQLPESLFDVATAMAGSAPGFIFRLIEAEARFGEKQGMKYEDALKIAAQTFLGAARLIERGASPTTLIHTIATPNGVTQAGFDAMSELELDRHFQTVLEASVKRCRELST